MATNSAVTWAEEKGGDDEFINVSAECRGIGFERRL
jgi:hypothetical protein